ncbi:hypothetical protein [Spirosoma flavum]|uniref:Uncharacterized protein n=1 Tax=Spirosoma flavum TaxID=2048557 RepID=A0ABW6APS1_9BACT
MTPPEKSFDKLLEHYVFSVAAKFIGLANQETQTELIKLISSVDTASTPGESTCEQPLLMPIEQLEKQWQQVLTKPVNLKSVHDQWLIALTRQQIKSHEVRIAHLELAIIITEQSFQRVQCNIPNEPSRSRLLNYYEVALKRYQQHLATAQTRKFLTLNQLPQR